MINVSFFSVLVFFYFRYKIQLVHNYKNKTCKKVYKQNFVTIFVSKQRANRKITYS